MISYNVAQCSINLEQVSSTFLKLGRAFLKSENKGQSLCRVSIEHASRMSMIVKAVVV
jgi:hypothetical protein